MPTYNNWGVSYSTITFFEGVLQLHSKVESFSRVDHIFFRLTLKDRREINVLLVNEYVLGLAAVHRAIGEFPGTEYIVNGGNWNGYTREAKKYGTKNNIGIFVFDEFLSALHYANPKKYVKRDEDGNPVYNYKTA